MGCLCVCLFQEIYANFALGCATIIFPPNGFVSANDSFSVAKPTFIGIHIWEKSFVLRLLPSALPHDEIISDFNYLLSLSEGCMVAVQLAEQ